MHPEYSGDEYDAGYKKGFDDARDKYERQLAAQAEEIAGLKALVREMVEPIQWIARGSLRHWTINQTDRAQARANAILNRDEVKTLLEGE